MFYYLNGTLVLRDASTAVLDCSGVGYRLTVSANTSESIAPRMGMQTKLLTYLQVREDGMELFGFFDQSELDTFRLLITVSGVGPTAALSILSAFTPEKFALAVCTEDKKVIARANGIGPKTAARIILELRDKMAAGAALPSAFETASVGNMVDTLYADGGIFNEKVSGATVLRAKFRRDDTTIHMLANKSRADAELTYNGESGAELWNPSDGSITSIAPGETVTVPAMRAIFVLY